MKKLLLIFCALLFLIQSPYHYAITTQNANPNYSIASGKDNETPIPNNDLIASHSYNG